MEALSAVVMFVIGVVVGAVVIVSRNTPIYSQFRRVGWEEGWRDAHAAHQVRLRQQEPPPSPPQNKPLN